MLLVMTSTERNAELDNWEILSSFLPEDWADQAWDLGAMRRARYIKDPAVVLRMLLMHVGAGCSLAETAARCRAAGLAEISSVGVFKRLRAAEPWFRWLAQQLRGATTLPMLQLGRRLRAVDASAIHEPGTTGTDWKLHYCVNLSDLHCDFFQLTDIREGGETFRRVPVVSGDVLMGDRVYAAPPGVSHVVDRGGDVIVRLNRAALPLYEPHGERIELLPRLRQLRGDAPREYEADVKDPRGQWIHGRLLALRRSTEATRWAQKRMQRIAQRRQETVTSESLECAKYFMVWSTLPAAVPVGQILECYRLRWQIELVFKRMKSILGVGYLPKTDPLSARAWLEGKIFVGLLIERMIHTAEAISPWGYTLAAPPQPMARN
jgi:hypothetical protein